MEGSMGPNAQAEEIDRIRRTVREILDATVVGDRPLLLSQLGLKLRDDLAWLKSHHIKLADFIRGEFAKDFEVGPALGQPNVLAVYKPGSAPQGTLQTASPSASSSSAVIEKPVRYNSRFWAAFAVPLSGKRRWLNPVNFIFRDLDPDQPALPDHLEITDDLVPPADATDRDRLIMDNVGRWLDAHGFERVRLTARAVGDSAAAPKAHHQNLLERVIGSLNARQLQQTVLPLDVIATLMRTEI
jgi:hypothetical protein